MQKGKLKSIQIKHQNAEELEQDGTMLDWTRL